MTGTENVAKYFALLLRKRTLLIFIAVGIVSGVAAVLASKSVVPFLRGYLWLICAASFVIGVFWAALNVHHDWPAQVVGSGLQLGTKRRVAVVILELDTAVFNWPKIWFQSFKAMLDKLVAISGTVEASLLPMIKGVHEKYGTVEYLALIQDPDFALPKAAGEDVFTKYKEAIDAYIQKRDEHTVLYPDVIETLTKLREAGCLIVGYSESQSLYTNYRIKKLHLDGVIDLVYCQPTHKLPDTTNPDKYHFYPSTGVDLKKTEQRRLPEGKFRPNVELLLEIVEEIDASVYEVAYIGGDKAKDIAMAQAAGVADVFAKYGATIPPAVETELLRSVSHEATEVSTDANNDVIKPTVELETSIKEVIEKFEFIPYTGALVDEKRISSYLDVWKKTIDVQQHFNDLELRLRNFALTALGVILSATALSLKEAATPYVSIPLILVALTIWGAFYLMDRHWYHRLLLGSVKQGVEIENRLRRVLGPSIALTTKISEESPSQIFKRKIHSSQKMSVFYGSIAAGLALFAILLSFLFWKNILPQRASNTNTNPSTIRLEPTSIKIEMINGNANAATSHDPPAQRSSETHPAPAPNSTP
jgi:phosphoglycolate phosphatase-like HAD superfamily hydrolase